jgi:exonuclease III
MKLITWNTAGRTSKIEAQFKALIALKADVVCLQEIQSAGDEIWHTVLSVDYPYIISSKDFVDFRSKTGPRKYHNIIASKFPIEPNIELSKYVPWIERLLVVYMPTYNMHIATTHIPPGVSNGWKKIDFFEGLFRLVSENRLILTGDFNSPQKEFMDGGILTWGQRINSKGMPYNRKKILGENGQRWHDGEYNLLRGIESIGYCDYFKKMNGPAHMAYSWLTPSNRDIKYRFDHIIGPDNIEVLSADYRTHFIDEKLSDHAPLIVELSV